MKNLIDLDHYTQGHFFSLWNLKCSCSENV